MHRLNNSDAALNYLITALNINQNIRQTSNDFLDTPLNINQNINTHRIFPISITQISNDKTNILNTLMEDSVLIKSIEYENNLKNQACSICIENFNEDEDLVNLPCERHVFHRVCIQKWFEKKKSCPVCRWGDEYNSSNENDLLDYFEEVD